MYTLFWLFIEFWLIFVKELNKIEPPYNIYFYYIKMRISKLDKSIIIQFECDIDIFNIVWPMVFVIFFVLFIILPIIILISMVL